MLKMRGLRLRACRNDHGTWKIREVPWPDSVLAEKKLCVDWDGGYTLDDVQKEGELKFGPNETQILQEAFVVKFLGPHKSRLLCTLDDILENLDLNYDDVYWNVFDADVIDVDGLLIIMVEIVVLRSGKNFLPSVCVRI